MIIDIANLESFVLRIVLTTGLPGKPVNEVNRGDNYLEEML